MESRKYKLDSYYQEPDDQVAVEEKKPLPEAANDNDPDAKLLHANDNDIDENKTNRLSHANDNEAGDFVIPSVALEEAPAAIPVASPEQNPQGTGSGNEDKKEEFVFAPQKIAIVSTEDAVANFARDAADARMTASKEELKGIGGFIQKIWKHNLFHEYYRQKEQERSRQEIISSGNLYASEGKQREVHQTAMQAVVERFTSEYKETINEEAGEQRRTLENDVSSQKIKELIGQFASGEIDEEVFKTERNRVVSEVLGTDVNKIQTEVFHTDNILEIAQNAKAAYEHGWSLDEINKHINIVTGRAKVGVRTEAGLSMVDRITDRVKQTPLGKILNEATIGAGVALAYGATIGVSERLARSQALAWGTLGASTLLGGAVAGLRENLRVKEERRQHSRDRAQGKVFEGDASRRQEMEHLIYQTAPATGLIEKLSHIPQTYESLEQYKDALATLAETEARIILSDRNKIDLIAFSSVETVEVERLRLSLAQVEAKLQLKKAFENLDVPDGQTFESLYANALQAQKHELRSGEDGLEQRDRLFDKMKQRKVAGAAVTAAVTGLAIGAAGQEAYAALSDQKIGVFDQIFGSDNQSEATGKTALVGLKEWLFGSESEPEIRDSYYAGQEQGLPPGVGITLPEGSQLLPNPDAPGTFTFMLDGTEVSNNISFENGRLTPDSVEALKAEGVLAGVEDIQLAGTGETVPMAAKEFSETSDLFSKVERTFWYDNDTKAFDKNELKLHWGGTNGLDENGNFVFSVDKMQPDGSFHKDFSVDAQKNFQEGNLKLLLSLSQDSQSRVVEVPIDANGNAVIDPNSEVGKMFFKEENGKVTFTGRFAEVAQDLGKSETGETKYGILSTHVGNGLDSVMAPSTSQIESVPLNVINATEAELPVDAFMPIPIRGRKPLEPALARKATYTRMGGLYGYGTYGAMEQAGQYKERMSSLIRENKDLDLSQNDEAVIAEYLDKQSPDRLQGLEKMIADVPPMSTQIKAVIAVPAYQEGKNLEKTIRNYAKLKNRQNFELVIFENHPKGIERDNSLAVMDKMREEFPDLNLISLYKEYDQKPAIGEVRKDLVDAVLLRKRKAGIDKSIAIISNDADLEDISENYVDLITREFETHPKTDALSAKLDYPEKDFNKFPLMHASLRLLDYYAIAFRHYYEKSPQLRGANTAFRSGAYAAVGGYNEKSILGEDLEIGWMLKEARDYDPDSIKYLNAPWLKTNSRRPLHNLLKGGDLINQYQDFHDNEEVRKEDVDALLESGVPFEEAEFSRQANAIYSHYHKIKTSQGGWCEDSYVDKSFNRAMRFLGVTYKVTEPGKIEIISTKRLRQGLEKNKKAEGAEVK